MQTPKKIRSTSKVVPIPTKSRFNHTPKSVPNPKRAVVSKSGFTAFVKFFQNIFYLTPEHKILLQWLQTNDGQNRYLLTTALQLKIPVVKYLPNYLGCFNVENNRVQVLRFLILNFNEINELVNTNLDELTNQVLKTQLINWSEKHRDFFDSFVKLELTPAKLIPDFDKFFFIHSGKIHHVQTFTTKDIFIIRKITDHSISQKIQKITDLRIRILLKKWLNTNRTIIAKWFEIRENSAFPPKYVPIDLTDVFAVKNDLLVIKSKLIAPRKLLPILDISKAQMTNLHNDLWKKWDTFNRLILWLKVQKNNLGFFRQLKNPAKLIHRDLTLYFDFKTMKPKHLDFFDENSVNSLLKITQINLRQIQNHYLLNQWLLQRRSILIKWASKKLSYNLLFPSLTDKIICQNNQILIKENTLLPDVLIKKIQKYTHKTLEQAYLIYLKTNKIADVEKILKPVSWLKYLWNKFWITRIYLDLDRTSSEKPIDLKVSYPSTPQLRDYLLYKKNLKQHNSLINKYSRKVLQENAIIGLTDANINSEEYIIEVKNVGKYFASGRTINKLFYNLNLCIKRNDFVVVLGPSGSGKTSLLNILSGLDRADVGDVFCNRINLSLLNDNHLTLFRRNYVSFIFQNYNLLPNLTVLENVQISAYLLPKGRTPFDIYELFDILEISEFQNSYPSQLSGGQQQRVAIARALAKHPKILFCDEPTGALDQKMSKNVLQTLIEINRRYHMTIVLITHNPIFAQIANSVIHIKDGKIEHYEAIKHPIEAKDLEL